MEIIEIHFGICNVVDAWCIKRLMAVIMIIYPLWHCKLNVCIFMVWNYFICSDSNEPVCLKYKSKDTWQQKFCFLFIKKICSFSISINDDGSNNVVNLYYYVSVYFNIYQHNVIVFDQIMLLQSLYNCACTVCGWWMDEESSGQEAAWRTTICATATAVWPTPRYRRPSIPTSW